MTPSTRAVGNLGEALALKELKRLGYRLVESNFTAAGGEVDIIAEHRGTLVFVEVKARKDDAFGSPLDAVDARKRRRIIRAARVFIAARAISGRTIRFDVVAVDLSCDPPTVAVLADAFYEGY